MGLPFESYANAAKNIRLSWTSRLKPLPLVAGFHHQPFSGMMARASRQAKASKAKANSFFMKVRVKGYPAP